MRIEEPVVDRAAGGSQGVAQTLLRVGFERDVKVDLHRSRQPVIACSSGALAPTAGRLTFAGVNVAGLAPHRFAALGVSHCMEGRRIFSTLSVEKNLRIAARGVGDATARSRLAAVYDLFPVLRERARQAGTSMSGGQQQMQAIGRALMARPRLALLDKYRQASRR